MTHGPRQIKKEQKDTRNYKSYHSRETTLMLSAPSPYLMEYESERHPEDLPSSLVEMLQLLLQYAHIRQESFGCKMLIRSAG